MDNAEDFAAYQSWAYNRQERLKDRHRYNIWRTTQVHSPEEHERYVMTVRGGDTYEKATKK